MGAIDKNARLYTENRIADLKNDIKAMSLDNGHALAIEFARIEELKNVLTILNGGMVPTFEMEVENA